MVSCDHGDLHRHDHPAGEELQPAAEPPHGSQPREKRAGKCRRHHERQSKAERIDGEQGGVVRDGRGRLTEREYRTKYWSDTECPTERESKAQNIGAKWAAAGNVHIEPQLALEPRQQKQSHHEKTENDYDRAAGDVRFVSIFQQQLVNAGRTRAEEDKNRARGECGEQAKHG